MVLLIMTTAAFTRTFWMPLIARSLLCRETLAGSDAILVENFDPDYLLFERAAALQRSGVSSRVLVPAPASGPASELINPVARAIAELMARLAGVQNVEIIPVEETEPYSLTTAYQIRALFTREHVRSVVVVAPALRSQRSFLVYRDVLSAAGIRVSCVRVFGQHTPDNWASTWHGIQTVSEQFIKLAFYRVYILPTRVDPGSRESEEESSTSVRP